MEEALQDTRFSHVLTDPRFRKLPKHIRKVAVDKRFKGMFKDKRFKGKCMFDKRGRPLDLKPSENLKELYDVSSESSEDDEEQTKKNKKNKKEVKKKDTSEPKIFITDSLTRKTPAKLSELPSDVEISDVPSESSDDNEPSKMNRKIKENVSKKKQIISEPFKSKKFVQLSKSSLYTKMEDASSASSDNEYQQSKKNRKIKVKKTNINEKKSDLYDLALNKKFVQLSKLPSYAEIEDVSAESNDNEHPQNKKNRKNKKVNKKINAIAKKKKDKLSFDAEIVDKSLVKAISDDEEELLIGNDSNEDISKNIVRVNSKPTQKNCVSLKNINSSVKNYCDQKDSSEESDDSDDSESEGDSEDKNSSEESDDSDDSESDGSSEDKSDDFDHQWEELRNEAPDTSEITRRIAVCNMDWDRIRAEDLLVCFNSFKPADGCITSVKIYPSEFGLKRMEEEKIQGPSELIEETLPLDVEEPEDKKGSKYHREKLRQYQIKRLKYFYAVVDCDSPETANAVYEQLNGMEYESSSVRFDLRFIPDDVTFEHEPTSVADKVPDPSEYKPRLFVTSALQQVKVNLTWDETDPKRREILQKAFTEPDSIEKELQEYLASSSGESEEEECIEDISKEKHKDRIAKYKALLLSLEEKEKEEETKFDVEVIWEPGLKDKTEELIKRRMKNDNLNPFEEAVQKRKEDRKMKKKERKAMQNQDDDFVSSDEDGEESSSIESKKKDQDSKRLAELALISDSKKEIDFSEKSNKKGFNKKKKPQKEENFKIDVSDPRFSAIYSSSLYNIDPSDPHFKDTEGNRALIQEKQRKLKSTGFQDGNRNTKRARYV